MADEPDEIVHARLCYDVARDLDGEALGAAAFPAAALLGGSDPGFAKAVAELRASVPRAVVDHDRFEPFGVAGPTLWTRAVREALDEAELRLARPRAA